MVEVKLAGIVLQANGIRRRKGCATLPQDVLEQVDQYADAHGYTRSGFLARAARRALGPEPGSQGDPVEGSDPGGHA